ncbi:PREDICTED: von Willebrand factor A domain-containing protein 3B-like [Elephantulus edwardii]|uniref:von Willebrand factor A domain-containing protein 3B-like n=1 Tax=Elephantulus edwardii TaxID=28737 RepID=UPI0003F06A74|nr:PREDICTED: von Willebrand factor A domain-containing protein 3B-like [Elephantulus edwardii]
MEKLGSTSAFFEQQLQKQDGVRNTRKDLVQQSLISSEKWLQMHGLKSNKLTLKQILSQIGFKHCEDYVYSLGRLVASRYADGLFPQFCRAENGQVYNLTAKSELIHQFVEYLTQAVESYRQRLDWLTSQSRQVFGVILEQCITIVLDLGDMLEQELSLCQDALTMVLKEQVAHIHKFNIIRVSQEPVKWQENAVEVTEGSITAAISWLQKLTVDVTVSQSCCLDALLEAGKDKTIESIYYFVVGDIPEESKELLLQMTVELSYPICTVSFNARGEGTIAFLKDLSAKSHRRFHAFAERTEFVKLPALTMKDEKSAMAWNSRKLKGKLPAGAGVREDVFLIWKEMEEADSTLAQLRRLVSYEDEVVCEARSGVTSVENSSNPEDIWDSKKWLQKYGLKAQKLSFYDVLADCSFRHVDGVVDIKAKPENESVKTSAETIQKTIHAKYCSRFVHTPWKDGSLVHVHVTKEKYKWYNERINLVLSQIERRIKWLQDGSQMLFGKVLHDCVYVLIDTSHSMKSKLDLIKDKIIQLIQEQLKYKSKFNFVTFDAQAVPWCEKLSEINEVNLKKAESWIRDIEVGSSTNILSALQIAFADEETQVIYLLTDGRPDQVPEVILDQIKIFKSIPVYTISFNYNDEIANEFLKELACLTGGELHFYNFTSNNTYPPETVKDEDLTLLLKEMEQGRRDLEKMQDLYSESLIMDWWYNGEKEGNNDKHRKEIFSMISTAEKYTKPQPYAETTITSPSASKVQWGLPSQVIPKKKVLHAAPTKTSLLRSQMSSLKSSASSERKDGLSNYSNWSVASSAQEMSISLLTDEHSNDRSLEVTTQEESQVYDQDSSDMSSENWLKTNGLVAKKLTIMNVLSVAAVPHNAIYVPVLNKHIVSKVFDEVFPMAHTCNDTNKMKLINPQGLKLNIYKQKVEQAIKSYEKRLNKIVWQALSQEEKEKLDANKPIKYLENKATLNEALERLNWPISLKELSLLENEILAGKHYIQQAMELQEATKKENYVSRKSQGSSTIKKIKSKRVDPLKGQKVIARCDENGFYFPGVVKKCVSPTHALVGFKYGDTKVVPTSFITPIGGAMPCPMLQVGDYVFAKIVIPKGFDFYVPAIVIALPNQDVPEDKFYTVLKCNNRKEFCPRSALIKISQNKYALSCSHINSPPISESPKMQDLEKNSTLRIWPMKEVDTEDLKEVKKNHRRKKKTSTKRLDLLDRMCPELENSTCDSRESYHKKHTTPVLGGKRHRTSLECPDISFETSARENSPQFPRLFRTHYKDSSTFK